MYDLVSVLLHPGIVLILAGAVIALLPKAASRYLLPLGALAALALAFVMGFFPDFGAHFYAFARAAASSVYGGGI